MSKKQKVSRIRTSSQAWALEWRQENVLDGRVRHIMHGNGIPVLFRTRADAREWAERKFSYIRFRDDLRGEPHGWRMPRAVRVVVAMEGP